MKNIIIFPIVIIIAIAFTISMVVPLYKERARINDLVLAQKEQLKTLKNDRDHLDRFIAQINAQSDEKEFLSSFVPDDPREQDIINAVSQLATQSNVSLFTLGFSDRINNRGFKKVDTIKNLQYVQGEFIVTGTYEDLKKFLARVFRMKRLYALNDISMEKIIVDTDNTDENAPQQPQDQLTLTGSMQFAYMTDVAPVNIAALKSLDLTHVSRIREAVAQTEGIAATVSSRANPFAP